MTFYTAEFGVCAIALTLPAIYSEYETAPKLMPGTAATFRTAQSYVFGQKMNRSAWYMDVAVAFVKAASLLEREAEQSKGALKAL